MALIGSSSRTDQHFYDESDNSVDLSDNSFNQEQESGGDSYYVSGFGTDFSVIDGGAFDVVSDITRTLERVFTSALDYGGNVAGAALDTVRSVNDDSLYYVSQAYSDAGRLIESQNDEVLSFAGDVYAESSNLAGQATVGANYSSTAVSKNMMYVAGVAALLFVASKVFK